MMFYMPTKVIYEPDCVISHGRDIAALGTHALIVTGHNSSQKNGSLADVTKVLDMNGVKYTVFNETEENPSVETIMKARDIGLTKGADFVIGIGGGSALDASKAVSVMMKNPESSWELMYDNSAVPEHLPLAAVPTTCGTGSEVTGVAVLTRHDLKTKLSMVHKVFPDIALCDGKYLLTAPKQLIANTAVDALSHMIESYINVSASPFSRMCAESGMKLWKSCKDFLTGDAPLDIDTANDLLTASTFGGMAIAQTGTSLPHALSYTLTYEGGIPHGAAVGAFQSGYIRNAAPSDREQVLSLTGFADTDELGQFIADISPVNVSAELLEQAAEKLLCNPKKLAVCPYRADADIIRDITGGVICSG
ncbi:MAG: iron-containing alcohol dehydrogenase [Ruminococcus sp.]|uniref:iron-containing alcohol dehydrogenase family protein n=1 Tax=Ruminococcus sp. TaxID=41978 RepID=UPI0025CFDE57|nr:iron-containing alcohol dehydrogenase family protein [Ruminococcus sp.]MCR4795073.1 iron-containing alcohol dehydrogenase [Ruminococcus sp.]